MMCTSYLTLMLCDTCYVCKYAATFELKTNAHVIGLRTIGGNSISCRPSHLQYVTSDLPPCDAVWHKYAQQMTNYFVMLISFFNHNLFVLSKHSILLSCMSAKSWSQSVLNDACWLQDSTSTSQVKPCFPALAFFLAWCIKTRIADMIFVTCKFTSICRNIVIHQLSRLTGYLHHQLHLHGQLVYLTAQ